MKPGNFYRPQTKFAKVVFTGVCLSTGGGLCPGGSVSSGVSVQGVYVWGYLSRVSVWESLSREVSVQGLSVQGGLCPGDLCPGCLCLGCLYPWEVSVSETPHTVTSRQYASYWNAFLLLLYTPGVRVTLLTHCPSLSLTNTLSMSSVNP